MAEQVATAGLDDARLPDDLAHDRHRAGHLDHQHPRRGQRDGPGQPQPGDSLLDPAAGPVPAAPFHLLAPEDGPLGQRLVSTDAGLGQRAVDYGDGYL